MATKRLSQVQPTSLRHAMDLCLAYGKAKHNRSVQRIADLMGVTSHWLLYKWMESGKLPTNMIRPFERACGATYVTSWIAHSAGKLTIDIPIGRKADIHEINHVQILGVEALSLLIRFYEGKAEMDETLSSLMTLMERIGWHHINITKHHTPELDLNQEAAL